MSTQHFTFIDDEAKAIRLLLEQKDTQIAELKDSNKKMREALEFIKKTAPYGWIGDIARDALKEIK